MPTSAERQWLDQWTAAGPALAQHRARELAALTAAAAAAATDALLALGAELPVEARRWEGSGLVDLQALLHGHRRA